MNMYLLIILVPLVLPWVLRFVWPHKITWLEMGISTIAGIILASIVYAAGLYNQTADVEILNGEVISKQRDQGHYLRSYGCNCRSVQSCSGTGTSRSCTTTQKCQTCYEDRYTVTWSCKTNLGTYTIEHLDRTSRSVYNTPDPQRYTIIQPGDPVAREHSYTNYVKAVPDSLFHKYKTDRFKELIPPYPERVFDFYRINRVFAMGVPILDLAQWNQDLSMTLRKLGPQKQANAVIVFANTNDQSYLHALEGAWVGGNKNDIIVVVGSTAYPKIDWVSISSWTDSELFKVQLRDEIIAHGTIDRMQLLGALEKHTLASYKRKEMKDFEYLKYQIQPPMWVLILSLGLGILMSVATSAYFYYADPFEKPSQRRQRMLEDVRNRNFRNFSGPR